MRNVGWMARPDLTCDDPNCAVREKMDAVADTPVSPSQDESAASIRTRVRSTATLLPRDPTRRGAPASSTVAHGPRTLPVQDVTVPEDRG